MNALIATWKWAGAGLKKLAGLAFPMFARARDVRGMSPLARRVLHLTLLVLIVVALGWVNVHFGLDLYLLAPTPMLREVWLPLLFLLVYSLCWLGWYLWKSLGPDQEASEFPDIDQAWEEALAALDRADIGLSEVPLFLVLGRPAGGEKALFQASQLSLQVRQAPRRLDAPLSVFADREAIYLTCAGASLLGRQATLLSGEVGVGPPGPSEEPEARAGAVEEPVTPLAPDDLSPPGLFSDEVEPAGPSPGSAQPASARSAPALLLEEGEEADLSLRDRPARPSLLKDADEAERLSARLRHLCRKVARERRPYCPINGILLLIPLAATDTDGDAKETATLCHRDLTAAREALHVHCPIVAVLCDLERASGFDEFLRAFPEAQRRRLLGQKFPLVPELDSSSKLRMIERGVQWIGNVLFASLVYRLWRVEAPGRDAMDDVILGNVGLFRFLAEIRERQRRLARILTRGIVLQSHGPLMLGGCYLAGTGRDPAREQGFVAGVFRQLVEGQNDVAWTSEALAEEADYRRWTTYGYLGIAVIVAGLIFVIGSLALMLSS